MKSGDHNEAGHNGSAVTSPLRVFILYEDLETGLHAKESFDHFLDDVDFDLDCSLDVCRFDLLENEDTGKSTSMQSSSANVVVVAFHSGHDLPLGLCEWLNKWLRVQQSEPSALVFLRCETPTSFTGATHWKANFAKIPEQANVEVFECVHPQNRTGMDVVLDELLYRENSSSEVLQRILQRRDSYY